MHPSKLRAALAALVVLCASGCVRGEESGAPQAAPETADPAPWTVPLYSGDPAQTHHAPARPDEPAAIPDALELWGRVLDCWPIEKVMDAELSVEGRVRNVRGTELDMTSRAWVGLVAKIPLYNGADVERERQREFQRRQTVAEAVGRLHVALSDIDRVVRQADITKALERRARERVRLGVAETAEQVGYFERVAALESERLKSLASAQQARLSLLAMCAPGRMQELDGFIRPYLEGGRKK